MIIVEIFCQEESSGEDGTEPFTVEIMTQDGGAEKQNGVSLEGRMQLGDTVSGKADNYSHNANLFVLGDSSHCAVAHADQSSIRYQNTETNNPVPEIGYCENVLNSTFDIVTPIDQTDDAAPKPITSSPLLTDLSVDTLQRLLFGHDDCANQDIYEASSNGSFINNVNDAGVLQSEPSVSLGIPGHDTGQLHFNLDVLNLFLKYFTSTKDFVNDSVPDKSSRDFSTIKNIVFKCSDCGFVFQNLLDVSKNFHVCKSQSNRLNSSQGVAHPDAYVTLELVPNIETTEKPAVIAPAPSKRTKFPKRKAKKATKRPVDKSSYKAVKDWLFVKSKDQKMRRLIADLVCPECHRRFPKSGSFRRHVECVHIDIKSFVCKICDAEFGRKYNFKRHLLVHEEKLPFSCGSCEKRFLRQSTMFSHILSIHACSVKPVEGTDSIESLMEDLKDIKDELNLNPTENNVSNENIFLSPQVCRNEDGKFDCQICKSTFANLNNLKNHVRYVHLNDRKHKCMLCDLRFTKKSFLREHIRKVHIHLEVPFCKVCKIGFVDEEALHTHDSEAHPRLV